MRTRKEGVLKAEEGEDRGPDLPVSLGFSKALDEMLLQHGEFPAPPLLASSFRYGVAQCRAWQNMIPCTLWRYTRTRPIQVSEHIAGPTARLQAPRQAAHTQS